MFVLVSWLCQSILRCLIRNFSLICKVNGLKNLKRRYFVLTNEGLSYYKAKGKKGEEKKEGAGKAEKISRQAENKKKGEKLG